LLGVTPALSLQLWNFKAKNPGAGGWRPLLEQGRAADEAGVDRLVVSDHVVFGEDLAAYGRPESGGTAGGRQPTGPDGHWLEPLTLLSVLAGTTRHCRLMTGILIAALRRPAVLAKALATLDVLSEGRVDLGAGVGWQREEYVACGLAFEGRGRLLDQSLEICQTLWRQQRAHYEAEDLRFEGIHAMPKPLQPGGVPIWVSGTLNKNVLARIVRFGSGWIPWGPDAADPAEGLIRVREALAAAGRDATSFQVTAQLPIHKDASGRLDLPRSLEPVPALQAAGITDFRAGLSLPADPSATLDTLAPLVTAFRQAT